MKKTLLITLAVIMLFTVTSCGSSEKSFERSEYALFDTVSVIKGYAESQQAFMDETDGVIAELTRLHRLFDIYNEYGGVTNLCTVNSRAGEWVEVDAEIIEFLKWGREVADLTGGKVDITLGAVLKIWHEARENEALPDEIALTEAKKHTGFDKLEIDEENRRVRLNDAAASIDAGALAKGWAVERAAEKAPSGTLINVGGNIRAVGAKPGGEAWKLGIQDPDGGVLTAVAVTDGSVVTSGDYQRYFEVGGVRYCHIIDPETLYPASKWRGVSVVCASSALADALSTALFLTDRESGEALAKSCGAEALWIDALGAVYKTEGFETMEK
jgi:thiamine biosynthesis lipoprotein